MKFPIFKQSLSAFAAGVFLLGAGLLTAGAEARETKWQQHGNEVKTRLVGTSNVKGDEGKVWLAWEAQLKDGWKTYWRSPGDAGLPTIIKYKGQQIDLAYPFPGSFSILGLETLGYANKVVIPFQVDKKLLDEGGTFDGSFMVCKDICIPYDTKYEMPKVERIGYDLLISNWLQKVPVRDGTDDLYIVHSRINGPQGKQRVIVDLAGVQDMDKASFFVEGPEGVAFSKPVITNKGDFHRFVVRASGLDIPNLRGKTLRITASDGNGKSIDITLD